jgi:hypothetical protein
MPTPTSVPQFGGLVALFDAGRYVGNRIALSGGFSWMSGGTTRCLELPRNA